MAESPMAESPVAASLRVESVVPGKYSRFAGVTFKPELRDRALQFGYAIPMGHIAVWIAVAIYFLATQKVPWITYHWNHLLPFSWWPDVRHDIRNGLIEGELASGAAIIAFANAKRPEPKGAFGRFAGLLLGYTTKQGWADKVMCFLHIPNMHQQRKTTVLQYIFVIPSVLLAGIPGNLFGFAFFYGIKPGIIDLLHKLHVHLMGWGVTAAGGTGATAAEANLARAGFDAKVIGILGTLFFARRVFLKVGLDYQEFLGELHAERYVHDQGATLGGFRAWLARPRWPLPATYRAIAWGEITEAEVGQQRLRLAGITDKPVITVRHGHVMRWVALALLPAAGWLAWYGYTILAAHGGV